MKYLLAIIGTVWAIPVSLIGVLLLMIYGPSTVDVYQGALVFRVNRIFGYVTDKKGKRVPVAGQTFGNIIFVHKKHWPDYLLELKDTRRLMRHEHAHTRQCWFWGPLILILYPLAFVQAWLIGGRAYKDSLFEVQAARLARKK